MEPKMSKEEMFRESLKDVVAVIQKLSSVCTTPEELASVCQLAVENDAQLRILLQMMGRK